MIIKKKELMKFILFCGIFFSMCFYNFHLHMKRYKESGEKNEQKNIQKIKKINISSDVMKKIEEELAKINDDMNEEDLTTMFSVAKMNYDKNPEIGIMYFEKLAKYKPEALRYLADYYYEIKDYPNYEKWEKLAIEKTQNSDEMYNFGLYFDEKQNYGEAKKYYLMAVEKNQKSAKHNLALLYGKMREYDKATELFQELGFKDGNGKYYTGLYYKTKKNYKKSEEIFNELIKEGNPDGYFGLYLLYEAKGGLKNKEKSFQFLKKGAEMGEAKSAFKLGHIYSTYYYKHSNKTTEKYYSDLSIKYYTIAANKGNTNAMFNLGLRYSTLEDNENAKKWFQNALKAGEKDAEIELKKLENKGK